MTAFGIDGVESGEGFDHELVVAAGGFPRPFRIKGKGGLKKRIVLPGKSGGFEEHPGLDAHVEVPIPLPFFLSLLRLLFLRLVLRVGQGEACE